METIEKTQLLGKHKALMNQHGLLPRLTKPLTLYEIRTGTKEVIPQRETQASPSLVKEGTTKMPTSITKKQDISRQASDWTLQADMNNKMQFPEIVQTSLIPDIVIQSTATQRLVTIQMTVSWKVRCLSTYTIKKAKYTYIPTLYN